MARNAVYSHEKRFVVNDLSYCHKRVATIELFVPKDMTFPHESFVAIGVIFSHQNYC